MFVFLLPIGSAAQSFEVDTLHLARCHELLQIGNDHVNEDSAIYYYNLGVDYGLEHLPKYHPIVSDFYNKLGIIYKYRDNYEVAELYYQKSLEIRKNHFGPKHTKVSATYNNLGLLKKEMNQLKESERFLKLSLEIDREILGEEHLFIAQTLNNLGLLYRSTKEYQKSAEVLTRAVEMKEKLVGPQHGSTASSYINLGIANLELGIYPEAVANFKKASVIFNKVGSLGGQMTAFENLGNVTYLMGDLDLSLKYYSKGLDIVSINSKDSTDYLFTPQAEDLHPGMTTLLVLFGKSRAYIDKYKETNDLSYLNYAMVTCQVGFDLVQVMLRDISYDQSKQVFIDQVFWEYEKVLYICYLAFQHTKDPAYLSQAFLWSEESKSFLLLQSIRGEDAKYQAGIPNAVITREKQFTGRLAALKSNIYHQKKGQNDATKLRSLQDDLFSTSSQLQAFLDSIQIAFPDYYKLVYGREQPSINEIQKELVNTNTVLIEYFLGNNHQFTFQVQESGLTMHHSENNLDDLIKEFVGLVRNPNSNESRLDLLSHEMYDILMAPLNIDTTVNRLLIVRDGLLNYLPFEVLRHKDGQQSEFLFENFTVSYQYSATVALESKKDQPLVGHDKYLAFAPEFNQRSDNPENAAIDGEPVRGSLMELKGTFKEIAAIAKLLKGKYYKGELATEGTFKMFSKDYDIIHLATHAIVDNDNPLNSRLLFTMNEDSLEDGDLHAWELYNMEFNAQMVVLSACNTGFGKLRNGEGVMSLGRAFAYAGCPSIIMSLWPAQDESTAVIMKYFYEGLSKGLFKDEALRQAKVQYLKNSGDLFEHPFYWAGFVVQGEPGPISLEKEPTWWMLFLILPMMILILFALYKARLFRRFGGN